MNFEKQIINQEIDSSKTNFEEIKQEIAQKIEHAASHPIKTDRFVELEEKIQQQKQKFFEQGGKLPDDMVIDDQIKNEILASGAIVQTIPEYKELLEQIAKKYNLTKEWVIDLLAHENAHANVSEQNGYDQVGYGTFFLADEKGNLESIQPAHVHEDPKSWSPIEVIENGIKTLEAPQEYNNQMSEGDHIERDYLIQQREQIRAKELEEVRKRLGI